MRQCLIGNTYIVIWLRHDAFEERNKKSIDSKASMNRRYSNITNQIMIIIIICIATENATVKVILH